jgi:WD40 repeat protein
MSSLSPSKSPTSASHVSPHLSLELEHAVGFSGDLRNCIYPHPNGRSVVYPAGGCVVIGDNADPHNQVFLRGHDDRISCLHLSPDGSYIVSGQFGKNADACVWSFDERKLMFRVQSHDSGIACAAFSHDSKLLLTAGVVSDKRLFVWDIATGKMNAQANLVPEVCTCCAWGGHERDIKKRLTRNYVFATAGARCIMLWTLDPYVGTLVGAKCNAGSHNRDYTCMAFGLGGEYLFCGSNSGDVTVFNVRNKVMQSTFSTSQGGVTSLLIAPANPMGDLSYLLVGGGDGVVNFMRGSGNSFVDVKQGSAQLSGMITSFGLSADARSAIVGTSQSIIYNVDIESRATQLLSESHSNSISAVSFPIDACETFATVSSDLSVRVWNLTDYTASAKSTVRGAGNPLCCDFGLECIISGWADGKIRCTDSETGEILWLINDAHRDGVTALKVSHNLRFVVSGGALGDVRLWDIKSKELVCHLKEHTLAVTGITLSLDDSHALSCSKDRSVHTFVIQLQSMTCMRRAILTWDLRREKRVAAHMQVWFTPCKHL